MKELICFVLITRKKVKGLKRLTPKQMLQRLQITYAQVKTGNKSESLLT